jgi:uncharacterized protein (DUF2252 family)
MSSTFPNPFDLAARQYDLDRSRMGGSPVLLARKLKKLAASPLSFFRGSARLYFEILAEHRELRLSGGPSGYVVGDMHLENVGAYSTDDGDVVFDLNDFDDAGAGPLWIDTQRLAVSVLLAGRSFQASAPQAVSLVDELLDAYDAAFAGRRAPPVPAVVADLLKQAGRRTRTALLDRRAPRQAGRRRFVRGKRYLDLSRKERAAMPGLVGDYVRALGPRAPKHAGSWTLVDAAWRVAGNGSLGLRRYALVVIDGKGTERIFELKEASAPPFEERGGGGEDPSLRVVTAARALTTAPPRQLAALGATPLGSLFGRKLCPEEDKLDLSRLRVGAELSAAVRVVGDRLGRAHARTARTHSARPVSRDQLVDRAVVLGGIFEAVYLAHARAGGRRLRDRRGVIIR